MVKRNNRRYHARLSPPGLSASELLFRPEREPRWRADGVFYKNIYKVTNYSLTIEERMTRHLAHLILITLTTKSIDFPNQFVVLTIGFFRDDLCSKKALSS